MLKELISFISLSFAVLFLVSVGFPQSSIISGTFRPILNGTYGSILAVHERTDGKIVIAGRFATAGGRRNDMVAVLNADGSADESFNMPVAPSGLFAQSGLFAMGVQADNKIIISGNFDRIGDSIHNRIARLNADGTVDESFNTGQGFNNVPSVIKPLPNGKILVGGEFWTFNSQIVGGIARLNSDGTLDSTFSPVTTTDRVIDIVIQADNKIIITGFKTMRLNENGSIDPTFLLGPSSSSSARCLKIQPDGKLLVGGSFTSFAGVDRRGLVRLNSDGSVDPTFTTRVNDSTIPPRVDEVDLQADGRILLAGNFQNVNGISRRSIARVNADGSLDTSLIANLASPEHAVYALKVLQNQNILVGGDFSFVNNDFRVAIALLNNFGSADSSFAQGASDVGLVEKIIVQTDGKLVLGGSFTHVNGNQTKGIIRLNSDGSIDQTFSIGNGTAGSVSALALQSDGKIIAGDGVLNSNGNFVHRILRINADGSLDSGFSQNSVNNSGLYDIAVQHDGKIIVSGNLFRNIARLNANGSVDNQFTVGTGPSGDVNAIKLLEDGKILIAGDFTQYNGVSRTRIARLNPDGTLDTSFNPASGFDGAVESIAVQTDGKIVCVGDFLNVNGIGRRRIARLNADGTVDSSFDPGTGANARIRAVTLTSNSDLVIGGDFTQVAGADRSRLTRLRSDGSLDDDLMGSPVFSYPDQLGFGPRVHSLASTGQKIFVGGIFSSINGVKWSSVAQFVSSVATVSGSVVTPAGLGLRNTTVILTDSQGQRRIATTSSFGLFLFSDVPIGESYSVSISSKRYRFAPQSIAVSENVNNLSFIGLE